MMMKMMVNLGDGDIRHAHNTPHSLTRTYGTRTHAYMLAIGELVGSRTEYLAPFCKRNPGGLERPVEEVLQDRPAAWAGWEWQR